MAEIRPMSSATVRRLMRAPDTSAAQLQERLQEARYRGRETGRLLGQILRGLAR